jgi:hypothetical protein
MLYDLNHNLFLKIFWGTGQHYPPGTQEDNNSFSSRNLMMEKGKELEFPEGRGVGKGRRSQSDLNPFALRAIGFP